MFLTFVKIFNVKICFSIKEELKIKYCAPKRPNVTFIIVDKVRYIAIIYILKLCKFS